MPINLLDPSDSAKRDKCFQAASFVPIAFSGFHVMTGTLASFKADQNYAVVGGSINLQIATTDPVATEHAGIYAGWSLAPGVPDPFAVKTAASFFLMACAMLRTFTSTVGATNLVSYGAGYTDLMFNPYCIYLAKGQTVYFTSSFDTTEFVSFTTVLRLMPTFV